MTDVHRQELNKMASEMSGSKAGSVAYIACYAKALKTIEEGLDEDTRIKYRAEAKQWSEYKPPPHQQHRCAMQIILSDQKLTKFARMFVKHGVNTLAEFSETMYHQYGVRVAILVGYCDNEGDSSITLQVSNVFSDFSQCLIHHYRYDNNHKLGSTSFKERNKLWPKDPLVEDFSKWIAESFGLITVRFNIYMLTQHTTRGAA